MRPRHQMSLVCPVCGGKPQYGHGLCKYHLDEGVRRAKQIKGKVRGTQESKIRQTLEETHLSFSRIGCIFGVHTSSVKRIYEDHNVD